MEELNKINIELLSEYFETLDEDGIIVISANAYDALERLTWGERIISDVEIFVKDIERFEAEYKKDAFNYETNWNKDKLREIFNQLKNTL